MKHRALSLFYYVRVLEPMYLHSPAGKPLRWESTGLRFALVVLGIGTLVSGVLPQERILLVTHTSSLLRPSCHVKGGTSEEMLPVRIAEVDLTKCPETD